MKLNWKWIFGLFLIFALIMLPLVWQFFLPYGAGYGMLLRGYRYEMPILGGFGMMMPSGMWFMWLLPLGVFILIGFAFGWAANQFTRKAS